MSFKPQELYSNLSLLSNDTSFNSNSDTVTGFLDTIGVQRPLRDINEARCASEQLNQVMASVVYGLELSDSLPNDPESVDTGQRIIMECCRLVSLRIEQFLDLQEEEKENKTKEIPVFLQEYKKIKLDHKDRILLFQMEDFYEMFWEDAEIASEILDLTLTFRNKKNGPERILMCGFPVHAANTYIAKLVKAGQRVAVCDQVRTDDDVLEREVVRVITPGEEVS